MTGWQGLPTDVAVEATPALAVRWLQLKNFDLTLPGYNKGGGTSVNTTIPV